MPRPRKLDVKRHPCGKVNRYVRGRLHGTPEAILRRLRLVKTEDPALAESPLGVMLARSLISAQEREAGLRYAWLYTKATDTRPHPKVVDATASRGGADSGLGNPKTRRKFLEAKLALILTAGRRSADLVETVAVFQTWPDFLNDGRPAAARESDARTLAAIQRGLTTLADHFGIAPRARQRA